MGLTQKPRKPTVCVDLDGVLARWDGKWRGVEQIGDPIPGAVEFTRRLSEVADVLVWTTRTNPDVNYEFMAPDLRQFVVDWLNSHGFVYRSVYTGEGKPLAAAYVDDRAVKVQPQLDGPEAFLFAEAEIRAMLPGPVHGIGDAGK